MSTYVDKVDITVESGHGGPGASTFRREKYVAKGGPDGGDGGKGGDIVIQATRSLQTLMDLKFKEYYKADNGESGRKKQQFGADGKDCVIRVPCGTMIFDEQHTLVADLTDEGMTYTAAVGGKGGKGNKHFATSIKRAPTYSQSGLPGQVDTLTLELRMIADVGLMGYPNAGKSTLLQTLTQANPKIASYPFTTLYPNLGVLKFVDREIVIADIPGIIEGASKGKGLGNDFLRHIDRTQIIFHVIDASEGEADVCLQAHDALLAELEESEYDFGSKMQHVLLSKIDQVDATGLSAIQDGFSERGIKTSAFSSFSREGVEELIQLILNSTSAPVDSPS